MADTQSGEMHNKVEKLAFHFTNNKGNKTEQADKAADEAATTTRSVAIKYEPRRTWSSRPRLPAACLAARRQLRCCWRVSAAGESVPELADFGRLFQLYLAKKPAWDSKNRDPTLRPNLPHSAGRAISVHTAMAVPFVRRQGDPAIGVTLHASYLPRSGGGERTYDFVAVRGPGTEMPRCDVVEAGSLLGQGLVLPGPTEDGCFFYQHLVLCESSVHQS
eukprot:scaffold23.g4196.t1